MHQSYSVFGTSYMTPLLKLRILLIPRTRLWMGFYPLPFVPPFVESESRPLKFTLKYPILIPFVPASDRTSKTINYTGHAEFLSISKQRLTLYMWPWSLTACQSQLIFSKKHLIENELKLCQTDPSSVGTLVLVESWRRVEKSRLCLGSVLAIKFNPEI